MTMLHFHEGELKLQDQVGMRKQIEVMTKHLMHDFMLDQHREFFEGLEYIFLGTVDHEDLPHASIVTGRLGFVTTPDPKTLVIRTGLRDRLPAFGDVAVGKAVSVLGLDLSNRRRNRMNGLISAFDSTTISITVVQSYGNCPKYINLREIVGRDVESLNGEVSQRKTLNFDDIRFITAADTFFIASYVRDGSGAAYEGVDINHRGGQQGFVSVDSSTQITIPDYRGNNLFNTFGNLLLNSNTGLLFVDFETGDQMHLHGKAELIDDEDSVAAFPSALRLLRVQIKNVTRQSKATGLRWRFVETSPVNPSLSIAVE